MFVKVSVCECVYVQVKSENVSLSRDVYLACVTQHSSGHTLWPCGL